jgi:hypothetical protein
MVQYVLEWIEKRAGLGGWVVALGALLAILFAWIIVRAEYLRRQERAKRRAEIELFLKIITAFEAQVQRFKDLVQKVGLDNDKVGVFYNTHASDPEWLSMGDLASIPVPNWPTLPIYIEFKRYWVASHQLMLRGGPVPTPMYVQRQAVHDESFATLKKLLQGALDK